MISAQTLRRALGMAAALLLVLGVAAPGRAQGLFYAEETKDGRIYVFNIKDNWERFKASGETGTGLTRLGVGPNGETVYADNETALELYFFKHGIKETVERPKTPVQQRRVARRQDAVHPRRQLLHGDVEPHPAALHLRDARRLRQLPGTGGRGDGKGELPHPPREVQAGGLVLQAHARVRAAAQLDRRDQHAGQPVPRGREHRLGRLEEEGVPRQVRPVQGALRPAAAHLVGRPAVRGPRHPGRARSTTRARPASRSGARWAPTSSTGASWPRTATAARQVANDNDKFLYTGRASCGRPSATRA